MSYQEIVKSNIGGDSESIKRRRELWNEIITTYDEGNIEGVANILKMKTDSIVNDIEKLLAILDNKI